MGYVIPGDSRGKCMVLTGSKAWAMTDAKQWVWEEFIQAMEEDFRTALKSIWKTARHLKRGKHGAIQGVYKKGGTLLTATKEVIRRHKENHITAFCK